MSPSNQVERAATGLEHGLASLLHYGTWIATGTIAAGAPTTGMPIVRAGIALFILLPIMRLILMLGMFPHRRDYRFGAIAAIVAARLPAGAARSASPASEAGMMPGAPSSKRRTLSLLTQYFLVTRTIMPAQHDETPTANSTPGDAKRKTMSITTRNLLMIAVGVLVFAIVATVVLYSTIMYGDQIPNFGIILMMTVPVIAGVAFRVGLDAWLDR